jgi:hypothetical protein
MKYTTSQRRLSDATAHARLAKPAIHRRAVTVTDLDGRRAPAAAAAEVADFSRAIEADVAMRVGGAGRVVDPEEDARRRDGL